MKKKSIFTLLLFLAVTAFSFDVKATTSVTTAKGNVNVQVKTLTVKNSKNEKQDGTIIKVTKGTETKIAIVDLGENAAVNVDSKAKTNAKKYTLSKGLSNWALNDKKTKLSINTLVITHAHHDHYADLKNLVKWANAHSGIKVYITNIYLNGVAAENDVNINNYISSLMWCSNVTIKNIWIMGQYANNVTDFELTKYRLNKINSYKLSGLGISENDADAINNFDCLISNALVEKIKVRYSNSIKWPIVIKDDKDSNKTLLSMCIMPSLGILGNGETTILNNSSMLSCIRDYSNENNTGNFAFDLFGDLYKEGIKELLNNSLYSQYMNLLKQRSSEKIYYKVTHHGCRKTETYFENEPELLEMIKPYRYIGTIWGLCSSKDASSKENYSSYYEKKGMFTGNNSLLKSGKLLNEF